jgi:hypothetical protein
MRLNNFSRGGQTLWYVARAWGPPRRHFHAIREAVATDRPDPKTRLLAPAQAWLDLAEHEQRIREVEVGTSQRTSERTSLLRKMPNGKALGDCTFEELESSARDIGKLGQTRGDRGGELAHKELAAHYAAAQATASSKACLQRYAPRMVR